MRARECCFKGQICKLFFFKHIGGVVMERAGHSPSQREAKASERRLATHEGWLSTPWDPTAQPCLSRGQHARPVRCTKQKIKSPEDGIS